MEIMLLGASEWLEEPERYAAPTRDPVVDNPADEDRPRPPEEVADDLTRKARTRIDGRSVGGRNRLDYLGTEGTNHGRGSLPLFPTRQSWLCQDRRYIIASRENVRMETNSVQSLLNVQQYKLHQEHASEIQLYG